MSKHEERMAIARTVALKRAPYFHRALYKVIFVPTDTPTMFVTKGLVLGYGVKWAETATFEMLAADIVHELNHLGRRHIERFGNITDPHMAYLVNIAGDLAINPQLVEAGFHLDPNSVFPKQFGFPDNLMMEQYRDLLLKGGEKDMKDRGEARVGSGACGGISGSYLNQALEDQLDSLYGRTDIEKKATLTALQRDIAEHIRGRGRGTVPKDLVEFANFQELPPTISWEQALPSVITGVTGRSRSGGDEQTMLRPSIRSWTRGIIRPGLIEHEPEVAIVVDTSGSMGLKQLMLAFNEAINILKSLGIEKVWFSEADAALAVPFKRVGIQDLIGCEFHGRGGTDFIPAIQEAMLLYPRPDILIYFTDGDGRAPAEAPSGMEVVWAICPSYHNRAPCRWGHALFLSNDALRVDLYGDDEDEA